MKFEAANLPACVRDCEYPSFAMVTTSCGTLPRMALMIKPARATGYLSSISSEASFTYGELWTSLLVVLHGAFPSYREVIHKRFGVLDMVWFLRVTQGRVALCPVPTRYCPRKEFSARAVPRSEKSTAG